MKVYIVEAIYKENGKVVDHHISSEGYQYIADAWKFLESRNPPPKPVTDFFYTSEKIDFKIHDISIKA